MPREDYTAEDLKFFDEMEHWDNLQHELGYETKWSLYDGGKMPLEQKIFKDGPYLITYKCIESMGPGMENAKWITFTSVAKDGSIGAFWEASENVYQQAKAIVGDWHTFIENFEFQDNGSVELVTGS